MGNEKHYEHGHEEHGSEQERITSWQRIYILFEDDFKEKKSLYDVFHNLKLHYNINSKWEDVIIFMREIQHLEYTDRLYELNEKSIGIEL